MRQKKIPLKKELDEMSAMPGRKARKAEETAEGLLGVMKDEEETSVHFEDVDKPPDTNYHEVMANMIEEDKQMVNEQYSHYLDAIKEAWSMMGIGENKGGMKVMELCCEENSGLGQAVESVGGTIIWCGLFNNCDIMKRAGYTQVERLIEKERPDILWLSLSVRSNLHHPGLEPADSGIPREER